MKEYIENNMQVIEVEDYMSMEEYANLPEGIDLKDVAFSVLWNTELQAINKGFIFVFRHKGVLYNILLDDGLTMIDERTFVGKHVEERFLSVSSKRDEYHYSLLKHNDIRSTYYTAYFSNDMQNTLGTDFTAREAYDEISTLIKNLEGIEGIENIIVMERINDIVISDIKSRMNPSL